MIVDDRRFDCISHAVAMEIAQHFLLFCVDAVHGLAGFEVLLLQFCDPFKLNIAVCMLTHRSLLLRLAA